MLSIRTGMPPNPLGFRYLEGQIINWAKRKRILSRRNLMCKGPGAEIVLQNMKESDISDIRK